MIEKFNGLSFPMIEEFDVSYRKGLRVGRGNFGNLTMRKVSEKGGRG